MPSDLYIIGDVIGRGSYGEVILATHKKDKKKYVIKNIDLQNASSKERTFAQQEVEILSKLRHPNIVSYKESYQSNEGYLSIVMGYCEAGDLYTRLKKQAKTGEYLSETQTVEWFVQIAMALQYMHDRHILHRDLKTQNIFLTKSKIIKLGDLGIARVLDNNVDMATTMIGTPYYMSPELFSNKPYNHKSDVWALGCCVYEMATLKHAFNAKDMNALVYKILKGKTPPMPTHYSQELQDIIKAMLSYDPTQRPSASRILRHAFIKKHIAIFLEGTKNRRKSRGERPKKAIIKSDDSGYSEASVDAQGIATASNVEIIVSDKNNDVCNQQNKLSDIDNNKKQEKKSEYKNDEKKSEKTSSGSSSNVRKVLSDRVQARAKLKQKEQKQSEERIFTPPVETSERNVSPNRFPIPPLKSSEQKNPPPRKVQSNEKNNKERVRRQSKEQAVQKRKELSKRPLPVCPIKQERRLPQPRFKEEKIDSVSTKYNQESPKVSSGAPNMAARQKRRQKQQENESKIISPRIITKKDSITSIVDSYTPRSSEEILRAHRQRNRNNDFKDSVDGIPRDSVDGIPCDSVDGIEEDASSERTYDSGNEDEDESLSKSENKNEEVACLIDNLQATLKLDSQLQYNSRTSPEQSSSEDGELSPSATGRLHDRILRLRNECIEALGEKILNKAYGIIDNKPEHQIEGSLISLLGQKNFDLYSGQIWQLKFCEEFQF